MKDRMNDRKRKHQSANATSNKEEKKPFINKATKQQNIDGNSQIKKLDEHFLVKHPPELLQFWAHAVHLNTKSPTDAFSELNSLKLVGPFTLLEDLTKNAPVPNDYLVIHRFSTDLPEIETILLYRGGRFCYWRDTPNELPKFLVHVSNKPANFPVLTIVGEKNPFSALAYLALKDNKKSVEIRHLFSDPDAMDLENYDQKYLQLLKGQRNKNSLGKPFHGLGIKVEVNEKDIGYRPVTEDINRLKREIQTCGSTDNEDERKMLKDQLFKLYTYVQFANDEMDFGMGLEFGHDLFVSNYECFDGMAKRVLVTAYKLLDRNEFATILEKHWSHGRRANDGKLIN